MGLMSSIRTTLNCLAQLLCCLVMLTVVILSFVYAYSLFFNFVKLNVFKLDAAMVSVIMLDVLTHSIIQSQNQVKESSYSLHLCKDELTIS